MMPRHWLVTGVLCALGCGNAPTEAPSQHSSAIVAGVASGAEQDSVVMLHTQADGVEVLCSGTWS
jgi:phosphodiesterase/alkaline phosphatase D-like protein